MIDEAVAIARGMEQAESQRSRPCFIDKIRCEEINAKVHTLVITNYHVLMRLELFRVY